MNSYRKLLSRDVLLSKHGSFIISTAIILCCIAISGFIYFEIKEELKLNIEDYHSDAHNDSIVIKNNNANYHQRILSNKPSTTLTSSADWIEKELPNPNLVYSEVIPLSIKDDIGGWKLWVGIPDSEFISQKLNSQALEFRNWAIAAIWFFGLAGIVILYLFRRNHLQIEKELTKAKEKAEAETGAKARFLDNIIDHAVDCLITIDTAGIVLTLNSASEHIFGYSKEEVIGHNIKMLIPEPYNGGHDKYLQNYTKSDKANIIGIGQEVIGKRKDGTIFPMELAVGEITMGDGARFFSFIIHDITERKIAEESMSNIATRLELGWKGAGDGMWDWDIIKNEKTHSDRFKELLGYTQNEMGSDYESWSTKLHSDDKEHVIESLNSHLKNRTPYDVEYRLITKSGEWRWFRAKGQATWDSAGNAVRMAGSLSDITEKKLIEQQLKENEERFQLVISGTNDGIWDWTNIKKDEEYWSPQFFYLLGYENNEIKATYHAFRDLLHPDDVERVKQHAMEHFRNNTPYNIEYRLKKKSGEYCWFRAKATTVRDTNGKVTRMVGSIRDISARKAREAELAVAKDQAEQATKLKSEFLANMSHEIRTPMNGVIGMTNLLLDTDLDATQRSYAKTAITSAEALLQIINDILDFSKIEAGKIELEEISFDLQLLCEEVCEMMSFKANEKKIELLLRYPHDVQRFCIGDPGRVRQILFNLVNNSIKFTDSGHVMLSFKSTKANNGKVQFHVEVEDTGIGVPEDKVDLIFNKFSQADQSTARKFGGTGLGLSICKELTRMMSGDIGVRSTYGVGSTFWFDIVLSEDNSGTITLDIPNQESLKGLRILVVDDNEVARDIIREQLIPYGIEILEASSGKNALKLLENDNNFDIAVLDFMMPEMDGAELGRKIKENPLTKNIALLIDTSSPNHKDKDTVEKIGFAGYLSKPLSNWHLRDALCIIAEARKSCKKIPMITQHSLKEAKAGLKEKVIDNLQFTKVHILLAEDNPINQMVATTMLEKYGCRITTAADGEEAVKQVKQNNFDLVFMDCQMPIMDGYEATGIIRKLEEHKKSKRIPIIAFTANAMKGDDEKCLAAGMDDYIPKPVRQSDMERVLIKWLPEEKRANITKNSEG